MVPFDSIDNIASVGFVGEGGRSRQPLERLIALTRKATASSARALGKLLRRTFVPQVVCSHLAVIVTDHHQTTDDHNFFHSTHAFLAG